MYYDPLLIYSVTSYFLYFVIQKLTPMNIQVSKTASIRLSQKKARQLNDLKQDLQCLFFDDLNRVKGGTVFRIRRSKKLCGNIVPQ